MKPIGSLQVKPKLLKVFKEETFSILSLSAHKVQLLTKKSNTIVELSLRIQEDFDADENDLMIAVGTEAAEGEVKLSVGDSITFNKEGEQLESTMVKAKASDSNSAATKPRTPPCEVRGNPIN